MKNIRVFLSKTFQFLEVKFSIYLNRRVFVMKMILPIVFALETKEVSKWLREVSRLASLQYYQFWPSRYKEVSLPSTNTCSIFASSLPVFFFLR